MNHVFLFVILITSIYSCKKLGCTDENALNFEEVAQKDDESCTYEGSVGIWFDSIKADEYESNSIIAITYFIDGDSSTTVFSDQYVSTIPTCGSPDVFTVKFNMGKASSETHNLIVKSETGAIIDSYKFPVEGGSCSLYLMK
ncbi:MAG: hypothetical protein ACSHXL_04655 [Bacteroidota bacterium]